MPMTVAVAGRSDTMSEYVARGSRAIASWSKTYGIDRRGDPDPDARGRSATGRRSAGTALEPASGVTTIAATSIAAASPSSRPNRATRETRCASTM